MSAARPRASRGSDASPGIPAAVAPTAAPRPVGRVRPPHLLLLLAVVAGALGAAFAGFNPDGVPRWSDMWDYLQLARQIHAGHGFTSLFTYPIFLPLGGSDAAFPLVWRPPGFPLLVAALFPLGGGPFSAAPLALQIAGYVLAVLGTYLLALEFVEARWALLAALVVALSPDVLGVAEPGIATALYTAGLTFGFWLATRATGRRAAVFTGLAFGVLMLLRGETLLLVPALVWMLWAGERGDRHRRIWLCLAAFLVVQIPWFLRLWHVTGRPFFSPSSLLYVDTAAFPGWESSRRLDMLARSPVRWALGHAGMVAGKSLRNLFHYLRQALLMPLPALAPFVWAATGRLTGVGKSSAYCASVLIGLGCFVLLLAPLEYAPRLLHPFIPLLAVVGVILLARFREYRVLEGQPQLSARPVAFVAAAVVALAFLEFVAGVAVARREWPRTPPAPPPAVALDADSWYYGDYPSWYAWRLNRRFVWLPVADDVPRARVQGRPAAGLLLDSTRDTDFDPTGIGSAARLLAAPPFDAWSVQEMAPYRLLTPPAAP